MTVVRVALGSTTGQKTEFKMVLRLQKKKYIYIYANFSVVHLLPRKTHEEAQPMYFLKTEMSQHQTF